MTEENLKKYFDVYTDCWKLFRKYSEPNDAEEFWKSLFEETNELHKKYGKSKFSEELILATAGEIDRIFRKRKE
ncbi:hypothetical protein V8Q34_14815 [Blautia sp. JLR.GB0024]|uniref:hypothetical protein n=1 Tax=Blautia sp. JLR.GB0024 TaxID=3123295 RepID=UPI003003FCB1